MLSPDAVDEDDGVLLSVVLSPSQVRLFLKTVPMHQYTAAVGDCMCCKLKKFFQRFSSKSAGDCKITSLKWCNTLYLNIFNFRASVPHL